MRKIILLLLATCAAVFGDQQPDKGPCWQPIGRQVCGVAQGPTLPTGFRLAGVGDFNGDGVPDYVLIDEKSGNTFILFMEPAR